MLTILTSIGDWSRNEALLKRIYALAGTAVTEIGPDVPAGLKASVLVSDRCGPAAAKGVRGLRFWARLDNQSSGEKVPGVLVVEHAHLNADAVLDYLEMMIERERFALENDAYGPEV